MSEQTEIFYLDPKHKDFVPQESKLTFKDMGLHPLFALHMIMIPAVLFYGVMTVFGFYFVVPYQMYESFQFHRHSQESKALVLTCANDGSTISVIYSYAVKGERYIDDHRSDLDCKYFPPESDIFIRYLKTDPTDSRFSYRAGNKYGMIYAWLWLLGIYVVTGGIFALFSKEIAIGFAISLPMVLLFVIFISPGLALFHGIFQGIPALWRMIRHYRPLVEHGQIIDGELVAVEGVFNYFDVPPDYVIKTQYQFTAPSGKTCTGKQRHERQDLKNRALPTAGTPIKVLYASDRNHIVL